MPYDMYGSANPYAGAQMQPVIQGKNAMNNMGNQIMQASALANALSSANLQSRYGSDAALNSVALQEQGRNSRLNSILPLLLQSFGGGGGGGMSGGGGGGSISTNYGAGATYGSQPMTSEQRVNQYNTSTYLDDLRRKREAELARYPGQ